MFAAYSSLKNAEKVKLFLQKKEVLHQEYLPLKEMERIYFPMTKKIVVPNAKVITTKFSFPVKQKPLTIDQLLKGKLTAAQLKLIPRSQEIIGKIMILEVPDQLKKKEKVIAEVYLRLNNTIETVVRKNTIHSGVFRTRTVKILAGKKTKETIHYENGIKLKLHLEKTYYSAKTANERLRIAKQVKPNEDVLVMFSGAAPYLLVIAKNTNPRKLSGIEINPLAHHYATYNIIANGFGSKINLFEGDVRKIVPKIKAKFDRIVMPLPKIAEEFFGLALSKIKPNGTIHLYAFLHEYDIVAYKKILQDIAQKSKHYIHIVRYVKCGQFSPGTFRICFDIKVKK
ncbi:hypothetical protein COV17_01565 [Candidatus Woesearchaeota archaeon CG10_big_fil_rev_8_21_14_0_10_36_11]|nr:MAG: hypothetical protein COV17_01565 [Candidatus Woesearchaeota archaeon CG10_big_fil_rev_8_21_14_0_10_36_11]